MANIKITDLGVNDTYGAVRKPGTAIKTYTDDLTIVSGDKIRIQYRTTSAVARVDFTGVSVTCIDPLMNTVLIGVYGD